MKSSQSPRNSSKRWQQKNVPSAGNLRAGTDRSRRNGVKTVVGGCFAHVLPCDCACELLTLNDASFYQNYDVCGWIQDQRCGGVRANFVGRVWLLSASWGGKKRARWSYQLMIEDCVAKKCFIFAYCASAEAKLKKVRFRAFFWAFLLKRWQIFKDKALFLRHVYRAGIPSTIDTRFSTHSDQMSSW